MENAAGRGAFDLVIDVGALAGTITATYLWLAPLFLRVFPALDAHATPSAWNLRPRLPVRQESFVTNCQEARS